MCFFFGGGGDQLAHLGKSKKKYWEINAKNQVNTFSVYCRMMKHNLL